MEKQILVRGMSEEMHHAIKIRATIRKMTMAEYIIDVLDKEDLVEPVTMGEVVVTEPVTEVEA